MKWIDEFIGFGRYSLFGILSEELMESRGVGSGRGWDKISEREIGNRKSCKLGIMESGE